MPSRETAEVSVNERSKNSVLQKQRGNPLEVKKHEILYLSELERRNNLASKRVKDQGYSLSRPLMRTYLRKRETRKQNSPGTHSDGNF